jgi:carbamoyl-phosphate synthase small subunit
MTYPLQGNYGVPDENERDFNSKLRRLYESTVPHITGVVVANYSPMWSHWHGTESLGAYLRRHNVAAITGVDTREVAKHLRTHGSMLAKIIVDGRDDIAFEDPYVRNLVDEVSTKVPYDVGTGPYRIVLVDCGAKHNILRSLAKDPRVTVRVVPWNAPIDEMVYDGLMLTNGPGDPRTLAPLIERVRRCLQRPEPIFGICLGNQLLALAAGARVTKMKFGNRGVNVPCINEFDKKVVITSQNHGFAVDASTLPSGWHPYYTNANDFTNEGIVHASKPVCAVQFHPEARSGPLDSGFLFKQFIDKVVECKTAGRPIGYSFARLPRTADAKKVLILGSGGLQIGQAGEFDYSGSQCLKALREEGVETILINPNIATIQTGEGEADKVFFLPVTVDYVEQIFKDETPDAILLGFGGQTALNTGVELAKRGLLEKYNVKVLGTPVRAIEISEDRELFKDALKEINASCA